MARKKTTQPKAPAKTATKAASKERVKYFRIIRFPLKPGDCYEAFQGEVIEVEGDKIVSRNPLLDQTGKPHPPNLFEYAQAQTIDHMDPRNVKPIVV